MSDGSFSVSLALTRHRYVDDLENMAAQRKRKSLLLIDNAPSHIYDKTKLKWLQVEELDPNLTAHIQPLDGGIIRAFKAHYRRLYLRHVLERDEAGEEDIWHINQLEGMRLAEEAWSVVSTSTIVNCWKHTGIVSPRGPDGITILPSNPETPLKPSQAAKDAADISVTKALQMLQTVIDKLGSRRVGSENVLKAAEMVDVKEERVTEKEWTDEEIVMQVQAEAKEKAGESEEDSDDEDEPALWSHSRTLQALKELQRTALVRGGDEWVEAAKLLPRLIRCVRHDEQVSMRQTDLHGFLS